MDKISLVGLFVGLSAILAGQVMEGGHVASLIQPTVYFIVVGKNKLRAGNIGRL